MSSIMEEIATPVPRVQSQCFACGAGHPHGLGLQFRKSGGEVVADWTPSDDWQGYEGVIHGGIVSTVLDEAMAKAVSAAGQRGLTCQLEVRFRKSIAPGEALTVRGRVLERHKRLARVEAEIRDAEGNERAHGRATFLAAT